ncbi:27411_t:CDS:2, partial [Racocetra persica]
DFIGCSSVSIEGSKDSIGCLTMSLEREASILIMKKKSRLKHANTSPYLIYQNLKEQFVDNYNIQRTNYEEETVKTVENEITYIDSQLIDYINKLNLKVKFENVVKLLKVDGELWKEYL